MSILLKNGMGALCNEFTPESFLFDSRIVNKYNYSIIFKEFVSQPAGYKIFYNHQFQIYRESPGVGAGLKPAPTEAFIVRGGPNRVMAV